ncbi:MAG TPA: M1 family metallopeptidase [Caulobacteraceae bacterium]|nr:M1 family metallopeptidase [Caulobacteraceae bacterium]
MRAVWVVALVAFGIAAPGLRASAAMPKSIAYDPRVAFAPLALPEPASRYRSSDGSPGPDYWQNRADYQIAARLDPASKTLSGQEVITYTNNSPDTLDVLWLQLDQNIYRRDSRAGWVGPRPRTQFTDGDVLEAVEVERGGKFEPAPHVVTDTRLEVRLSAPLKAAGGRVRLRVRWHYTVPGSFGGRTAWAPSRNGDIYDIAQWYPRMAVYDDVRGWDTLPYLGNEFYLEYGTFDYAVTVPADMLVAGSGELTNPNEVLTPIEQARLARARTSDATVMIRTPADVAATAPANGATRTWRFHMEHTRDVSFAASRAFVWDAARIDLPHRRTALAQSVYPAEAGGEAAWGRSTEYLKFAVEEFSRRWFPYPWPNAINVAGPVGGMEYPALLFDSASDKGKTLFWLTVHEIGHTYFPMVVGTDERRWQWMDEGLNTFIDVHESDVFDKGVYGPKRDPEYAPGAGTPGDQIAALIADPAAPPIMTRADVIPFRYGHPISYFKTAYGLTLLREDILGPERFDVAFRKFIRDWAYKHPQPSDFFRAMQSEGGEDLSWFWRGWFFENWPLDLAVDKVSYVGADPAKGALISVENLGQLVLPATVRITFADGTTKDVVMPAETWIQSASHVIAVASHQPIARVVIDPDHRLPDRDRSNNTWPAAVASSGAR